MTAPTTYAVGTLPTGVATDAPLERRLEATTLTQPNADGKLKLWRIRVEQSAVDAPATIVVEYGQVGGKLVTQRREVRVGKNLGRANATTPLTQALAEAASKWKDQVEKGYSPLGVTTLDARATNAAAAATAAAARAAPPAAAAAAAAATATTAMTATAAPTVTTAAPTMSASETMMTTIPTTTLTTPTPASGAPPATRIGGRTAEARLVWRAGQPLLPMLAHDFHKRGRDIVWPCFAQRKLDGVRCLAQRGTGSDAGVILLSRTGKPYPHMAHVRAAAAALLKAAPDIIALDGELYADDLSFQVLVSLVRRDRVSPEDVAFMSQHVYLNVYDAVMDGTYAARLAALTALFATAGAGTAVRLLPTVRCANEAAASALHDTYVSEGYEGLILRNEFDVYRVGTRSAGLQKFKRFHDDEFTVVGFTQGEGVEEGCVVWECSTKARNGAPRTFSVRPRGTHEERKALFVMGAAHIGRRLTVRYQELTDDGLPRFPVGIAFRDYE